VYYKAVSLSQQIVLYGINYIYRRKSHHHLT